jgi:uncharacterized membrane protein YcjF (UPF0283 family)
MTETLRKPAMFSVDDPRLVAARPEDPRAEEIAPDTSGFDPPAIPAPPRRKGFALGISWGVSWGALFWSALSGLVLMGLGLAVTSLIEDLFARAPWLGAIGLVLGVLAGLALTVIVLREVIGLFRLATVEQLRRRALETIAKVVGTGKQGRPERLAGRLLATLDYSVVDEIVAENLHNYLENIQRQCALIHSATQQVYIAYPVESAIAS